jgi:hypothetical protein
MFLCFSVLFFPLVFVYLRVPFDLLQKSTAGVARAAKAALNAAGW